ncbi:hypothetical protein [Natrialba taiwanensis]|uniref:Uncharacterized protein n=1 Tax=Natrialba taiwanensis DSM 12281 TaxID=1230458 RepID=L9ZKX0_9EURY|nr:hypothetical protein [Natrialba taiwanensis]ELY87170.1 hypothetical protein C484_17456 [Natrialba taiwanensis DSM 12281]
MTDTAEQSQRPSHNPNSDTPDQDRERDDAHLDDVEEGAGCTEIWEHLAEQRDDEE